MKIPKIVWLLGSVIVILCIAVLIGIRFYSGEDNWICKNGAWQKHGQPSAPKPTSGCGDVTKNTNNDLASEIKYPIPKTYQVPILMYHYIRDASGESELGRNLSVSPESFKSHLKWLADNNYQTLKMSDLADPEKNTLSKIAYEKKKPIIITFDDGYEDAYTNAFSLLKEYNFIGTFYIIRDFVGREEYMNQVQINELEKAGMEIGSHSLSHPDLAKANEADSTEQIFDSKEKSTSFCYPAGKYNQTTVDLIKEAGYTTAVTTHGGIANETSDLLELPRVRVQESTGEQLGVKLN